MAEVSTNAGEGKKHSKKMSTRIDLTPMVDLGFLLITFFMLTTTLTKPKTMEIAMPVDGEPTLITNAMTVILGENDKVFYYFGLEMPQMEITDFSREGLRKILQDKNYPQIEKVNELRKQLEDKEITEAEYKKLAGEVRADKKALTVIIKSDDTAKYKNLVDVLDEMKITNVSRYAIVDLSPEEHELINNL